MYFSDKLEIGKSLEQMDGIICGKLLIALNFAKPMISPVNVQYFHYLFRHENIYLCAGGTTQCESNSRT